MYAHTITDHSQLTAGEAGYGLFRFCDKGKRPPQLIRLRYLESPSHSTYSKKRFICVNVIMFGVMMFTIGSRLWEEVKSKYMPEFMVISTSWYIIKN